VTAGRFVFISLELVAGLFVIAPGEGTLTGFWLGGELTPPGLDGDSLEDEFMGFAWLPVELFPHPASRSIAAKNGMIFFIVFVPFVWLTSQSAVGPHRSIGQLTRS